MTFPPFMSAAHSFTSPAPKPATPHCFTSASKNESGPLFHSATTHSSHSAIVTPPATPLHKPATFSSPTNGFSSPAHTPSPAQKKTHLCPWPGCSYKSVYKGAVTTHQKRHAIPAVGGGKIRTRGNGRMGPGGVKGGLRLVWESEAVDGLLLLKKK